MCTNGSNSSEPFGMFYIVIEQESIVFEEHFFSKCLCRIKLVCVCIKSFCTTMYRNFSQLFIVNLI
jgi:hypothetical protein